MPIPIKRVRVDLKAAKPTELTLDDLQKQLHNVGLGCEHTSKKRLEQYKADVVGELPHGATQSFGIYAPKHDIHGNVLRAEEATTPAGTLVPSSTGNWEPSGTGLGYSAELEYIQFKTHFDWLKNNRPSFTGITDDPPTYTGRYDNVDAIKTLFQQVGTDASATLVKGIDKSSIESVLSNAISTLTDQNAKDYDVSDSRVIFLVLNPNEDGTQADGVGVLTIDWHLTIKDYKEKKHGTKHDTTLTISSRSVLYDDINVLNADLQAAKSHFKDNAFFLAAIPAKPTKVKIYENQKAPPATAETFLHGLPVIAKENYAEVLILYAPNLQEVGSIDNTSSSASTAYQKSVTSGFTFTMSQTLSIEAYYEATVEVVKAGVKVGFSMTFTESWSESTTETMTFTVPAGKKAFTYQGYLLAAKLRYDPSTDRYSYVHHARCLTKVLATSDVPLVDSSS